jgi:hypothetical protein
LVGSILLYAIAPGHHPEPDHRTFERLARTAADPGNSFASLVPEAARAALEAVLGEHPDIMAHRLVQSWWGVNEGTTFFRHPDTARAVRRMRIADQQMPGADPAAAQAARRRWRR